MGYLKIIENNTTWKCPKTATYEIICVASGTPNPNTANNPTSFGEYCTAYGIWPNSSIYNGYTFNSYGEVAFNTSSSNIITIGYGSGGNSHGALGKLNIARVDIKKDTEVICTVGSSVIVNSTASNSGVIAIKEIGEISENNITDNTDEKKEFTINLYRYDELYQTLKIKEGSPLVLPTLPIYDDDEFTGDVKHEGYTLSRESGKVYNTNQVIYPMTDMNLYAGYSYKLITTRYSSNSPCVAEAPGMCSVSVTGHEGSSGSVTFFINGNKVGYGSHYVNKGDVISYVINGNGLGPSINYPVVGTANWRS